jgi:hypothetical protein
MCVSSEGAHNNREDLTHAPDMLKGEKTITCHQTSLPTETEPLDMLIEKVINLAIVEA